MKKLFFLALMAFLWLPATTWADDHDTHDSGNVGDGHGDVGDEVYDGEQEQDLGSIVPSGVQLTYKILSVPEGTFGDDNYENGTVELEGLYSAPADNIGALYIPHEIQVVNVSVEGTEVTTEVNLYTVVGIVKNAFRDDSTISSVTIPYTVTYIGDYAFDDCENLTMLAFAETEDYPSKLETIGTGAFMGAPITSLGLPASVETLGEKAFKDCSQITSLVLPANLTTISKNAFDNCGKLEVVTLSGNTTLGEKAFGDCGAMTAVVFNDNAPEDIQGGASSDADPFGGDEKDDIIVYVPTGYAAVYASSSGWSSLVTADDELSWNFFSTEVSENAGDNEGKYYATYYVDEEGYILDGGTAYYVSGVTDGEITKEAINGIIPVNTAILIESSNYGDYYFYKEYEPQNEVTISNNMLYGSNVEVITNVNGETDGYYFYKLSLDSSSTPGSVGFYWGEEDGAAFTSGAYKAWLAVPQEDADGLNQISFKKDEGDTTGISSIEGASEKAVSGIYTIQGVRVSNMNQPGLYIVDGKKVLVK